MLEKIPSNEELSALTGADRYLVWRELCNRIDRLYEMERIWNNGWKEWKYEYKYRRGGKTLCALYARENRIAFMIIFGKDERAEYEAHRDRYSHEVQKVYDDATTYHDGKWMLFYLDDDSLFADLERLLMIKRKPNRK